MNEPRDTRLGRPERATEHPLGRRMRERRRALGLTMRELAIRAGLAESAGAYLSQLEAGSKAPSVSLAPALAAALSDDPEVYRLWAMLGRRRDPLQVTRAVARLSELLRDPRLAESLQGRGEATLTPMDSLLPRRDFDGIVPRPRPRSRPERSLHENLLFAPPDPASSRGLRERLRDSTARGLPPLGVIAAATALEPAIAVPFVDEEEWDARGQAPGRAVRLPVAALSEESLGFSPLSLLVRLGPGGPGVHEFPPGTVVLVSHPPRLPRGRLLARLRDRGARGQWVELFSNGREAVHVTRRGGGFEIVRPGDPRLLGVVRARVLVRDEEIQLGE